MAGHAERSDSDEVLAPAHVSRRTRLWYVAAALLVAGALGAGLGERYGRGHPGSAAASRTPRPAPAAAAGPIVRSARLPDVGAVQLYARASSAVVELNFGADRIRSSPVPAQQLTGPVSFGVTASGAFVRPPSGAPGFYIPDAGPARPLGGALADATVLPAPDPADVWTIGYRTNWAATLYLVRVLSGQRTGAVLRVPRRIGPLVEHPMPDGSGYLLASAARGSFDVRPDGAHRLPVDLAAGTVLASGDGRLLVATCAPRTPRACPARLLRLPDGHRLVSLHRLTAMAAQPAGVISPGGRTALLYQADASGLPELRLLDLITGRFRGAAIAVDPDVQTGALAYAPDGRWAFAVGAGGGLTAIDVRTGAAKPIRAGLPRLYQVAVRAPAKP